MDPRLGPTNGLQQIHLLLNAGLDTTVRAISTQVANRVLKFFHQSVQMGVSTRDNSQVSHKVSEYA